MLQTNAGSPLRPPISIFPRQPLLQQLHVAANRVSHHIEDVADERDRADKPIERDVGGCGPCLEEVIDEESLRAIQMEWSP